MKLIDHFIETMRGKFPEYDLSINEIDDNAFLDSETNAMWMMFQVCNAWQPMTTAPKDGRLIMISLELSLGHAHAVSFFWDSFSELWRNNTGGVVETHECLGWRPLPIPPLTNEGGV